MSGGSDAQRNSAQYQTLRLTLDLDCLEILNSEAELERGGFGFSSRCCRAAGVARADGRVHVENGANNPARLHLA